MASRNPHQHPIADLVFATPEPPMLGPESRPGALDRVAVPDRVDEALSAVKLSGKRRDLLRALVFLWHDHLDASHEISQRIPDADGSYVHGIMHRREPDYGNAAYWFRKVGEHPAFPELARRAARLLDERPAADLKATLLPGGRWDPFAFLDACESAVGEPPEADRTRLLRDIQALEFHVLLERFLA